MEKRQEGGKPAANTPIKLIFIILYFTAGPRRIRAGSRINAERKAKSPFIVIPIMRNGSVRSHTNGYTTSASSANGQHKKRSIIHSINVNMCNLLCYSSPVYGEYANLVSGTDPECILKQDSLPFFLFPFCVTFFRFHSKQFSIIQSG
jgi:hypothetical protein